METNRLSSEEGKTNMLQRNSVKWGLLATLTLVIAFISPVFMLRIINLIAESATENEIWAQYYYYTHSWMYLPLIVIPGFGIFACIMANKNGKKCVFRMIGCIVVAIGILFLGFSMGDTDFNFDDKFLVETKQLTGVEIPQNSQFIWQDSAVYGGKKVTYLGRSSAKLLNQSDIVKFEDTLNDGNWQKNCPVPIEYMGEDFYKAASRSDYFMVWDAQSKEFNKFLSKSGEYYYFAYDSTMHLLTVYSVVVR